jgi:hypothetical protein
MPNETLPHRQSSSRQTHITELHVIHTVEDGEYKQAITQSTDPNEVVEFLQKLVNWYESDVDSQDELFLHAKVEDSGYVYIRDQQGGEWVMWSVNEWVYPKPGVDVEAWNKNGKDPLSDKDTGINESTIRSVINAIVWAYEEPSRIKQQFDRVQIESANPN